MNNPNPPGEHFRRAPMLLLTLIDAAITLGRTQSAVDEVVEKNAPKEFEDAQRAMIETLSIVVKESDAFNAIASTKPKDALHAMNALLARQRAVEIAGADYLDKLDTWSRADAQTARIRMECVGTLMLPVPEGRGLSFSAADKNASEHPAYTEHKDYVVQLAASKNAAEVEYTVAKEAVRNAREIFRALTSEGGITLTGGGS